MLRITLFFSVFFILLTQPLLASWEKAGPEGGSVEALVFHPTNPSILYAGTQGGVYKTTDGGATWVLKNSGLILSRFVVSLAIDPSNPETLFAGHYGGISKTTDGGENWDDKGAQTGGFIFAIVVQSSNIIYAGSFGGGMFKSTDGGNQWNAINSGLGNHFVISLAKDVDGKIYAGTLGGGIFKSTNGGGNWSPVNNGLNSPYVDALAVDPVNPSIVYAGTSWGLHKSVNGGASWVDLDPTDFGYVEDVAIDPSNTQIIYVGRAFTSYDNPANYHAFGRSTDGGASWSNSTNDPPDKDVLDIAIHPTIPSTLFVGLFGEGIAKTIDNGSSWALTNTGMSAYVVNMVVTDPTNANVIYSGSTGGLHRSADNGVTWASKTNGLTDGPVVFSIAVDPASPNILYVADSAGVHRSVNSGNSWIRQSPSSFFEHFVTLQINPLNTTTLYGGSRVTGVWKSVDSGSSWTQKNNGITNNEVRAIVLDPNSPDTLYAGTLGGGVFKSTNGGNSWNPVNNGIVNKQITALVINPLDPQNLYAATKAGKVYKTTNGGSSWALKNSGVRYPSDFFCLAIHPLTPNILYGGVDGGDGVYMTTNGGDSWIQKPNGLAVHHEVSSLSISPNTDRSPHAGTLGDGVYDFTTTCSTITISPTVLPNASAGVPYTVNLTAGGGATPYTFDLTAGALPSGIFLSSDGTISGISNATPGDYNFTVRATDSAGCQGTQNLTITAVGTITPLFSDDFEDGIPTWVVTKGSWQESAGMLTGNGSIGTGITSAPTPWSPSGLSGCSSCTFEVTFQTNGGSFSRTFIQAWYIDRSNRVDLVIKEESDTWALKQRSGGHVVAKAKVSSPIQPGTAYNVRILQFNGVFQLWVDGVLKISMPAGAAVPAGNLVVKVKKTITSFLQTQVY